MVDVFGEMVVCIVGYFDDIKRVFFAHVIECAGILPRVGIKHGNAVAGGIDGCFGFVGKKNQGVLFQLRYLGRGKSHTFVSRLRPIG